MSGLVATSALWRRDHTVALTSHVLHGHVPSPLAVGFSPPAPVMNLEFGPFTLAAAVARTATLRDDAPVEVLDALQRSTFPMLETMIAEGSIFSLSEYFSHLADTERTLFAARVGGGITDLYMNTLGYAWRANAICLSSALDPHADFIYDGGSAKGHGVVLQLGNSFGQTRQSPTGALCLAARGLIKRADVPAQNSSQLSPGLSAALPWKAWATFAVI